MTEDEVLRLIGKTADEIGYECYVVGGYVRDKLLSLPNNDIDIVVVGKGETIARAYHSKVGGKLEIFQNFGTAMVNDGEWEVEFVGARKESYKRGSRKPIVEEGTLQDDQLRRDFTINAMAICLNSSRYGELVDPFNGQEDLKKGIIRTPVDPCTTFSDDPLRMLRCVRFATRFGFSIEPQTFQGIQKVKDRIAIISPERIHSELLKIIGSDRVVEGIGYLKNSGLLEIILPELTNLDTTDSDSGKRHKNNYVHTLQVLENIIPMSKYNPWLRLAALLHDIGKTKAKRLGEKGWTFHSHDVYGEEMTEKIFRRLHLPLDEKLDYVKCLVRMHMRPQIISHEGLTDSAVRRLLHDAGDWIDDLLILARADITTRFEDKRAFLIDQYNKLDILIEDLKKRDFKRLFQPCLNGDDIMKLTGLPQGEKIGVIKDMLKEAILDNLVENEREALIKYMFEKIKGLGL